MITRAIEFITDVAKYTYHNVRRFVAGTIKHAEGVIILSASALGVNAFIGEAPFVYALPAWIEAPMVIPVLSVVFVLALLRSAEHRAKRRGLVVIER